MRIALDGMGSDNHPDPEIQAAVAAAATWGDEVLLVGPKDQLSPLLANANPGNAPVRLVHAPDVFEMTDKVSARALRTDKNSMGVGMELLKQGEADAFVTAGNTGGAMAIGLARLGRIHGVKRPGLSAVFPVKDGQCVVSDIGANVECKPEFLVQFAIMGSVYAEKALGVVNPRVGLLSNGEEAGKGNELVKATYPLLQSSGLNFIGNVEGKELFGGEADVVVTDGFSGNVLLKSSEAAAKLLTDTLKEGLMSSTRTKLGALLAKPAFDALRKKLDPAEIGAVPLLGLAGLVFVGHGRSDARALVSAIGMARQAVGAGLMDALRSSISQRIN
jgi:glycerol-3-phosphate acyltransferase PlsX